MSLPESLFVARASSPDHQGVDLTPPEIAAKVLDWSRAKARLRPDRMTVLGVLAGVFIAFGAIFFTAIMVGSTANGEGISRCVGGIGFALGLLLVCMTGAELSTGNCLMLSAWAHRQVSTRTVTSVLVHSYVANAIGAVGVAVLMSESGLLQAPHGQVAVRIAEAKMALPFMQAFVRGIFCNALVCCAVWLILSSRSLTGKLLGLLFPIAAFVAIGFEHSIANLYFLPVGMLAGAKGSVTAALLNIGAVTAGNLVGGGAVAIAFWAAHMRSQDQRLPFGRRSQARSLQDPTGPVARDAIGDR